MKLWIDSTLPAPDHEYIIAKNINRAKRLVEFSENAKSALKINLIDIGDITREAEINGGGVGDFVRWLDDRGGEYRLRVHCEDKEIKKMVKDVAERNGWEEV